MAAQHQILSEEKILNTAVRLNRTGKVCAQDTPRFCSLTPRLCFLDPHSIHGEKERCREISPQRFSVKISSMKRVPRRVHLVAGKRVFGDWALRNNRAVELLDGNSLWRKHRALIRSAERKNGRAFLV